MKTQRLAAIFIIIIAIVVVWKLTQPSSAPVTSSPQKPDERTPAPSSDTANTKPSVRDNTDAPTVSLDEEFNKKLYTPVTYESPPSGDDGSRAYVRVPSTNSRRLLSPNNFGEFPVQPAGLLETVAVHVDLPDANPGDPVAVTILDGGTFPGEGKDEASRLIKVEKWGGVSFQFTTSQNDGHHRLRIQPSGGLLKIIDFYATKDSSSENL